MTARSRGQRTSAAATTAPSPLHVLSAAVHTRLDDHVDQVVRRVATGIPSLGPASTVALDELCTAARCVFTTSLSIVTEQREPTPREIATWTSLARRSAHLGVPLEDILQALRVCSTTLWEAMSQVAMRLGESHPFDVLEQAPRIWAIFDRMASEITGAHQAVGSALQVEHSQRVCAFLAALRRPAGDLEQAEGLARTLGLDPNGWYVAVVHATRGHKADTDRQRMIVSEQTDRTVMLLQLDCSPPEGEEQASWLVDGQGSTPAGIGIQRPGLEGARQALVDAEAAYRAAVALHLPVVKFRARWLTCLALEQRDQHQTLVEDAVTYLRGDEQMRATVAAYLQAEGSLPGSAALLGLHANTVAYRLRQLAERTGLDARSAHGTALAQVALTFAEIEAVEWEGSLGQAAS